MCETQIYTAKPIELLFVNYCFIKNYTHSFVNMKAPFMRQVLVVGGALEIQYSPIKINIGNYASDTFFTLWNGEKGL